MDQCPFLEAGNRASGPTKEVTVSPRIQVMESKKVTKDGEDKIDDQEEWGAESEDEELISESSGFLDGFDLGGLTGDPEALA